MYLKRHIDSNLEEWASEDKRKPLLVRGARQVGKTEAIRELGKNFEYFLELNFETDKKAHAIFEGDLDPEEICENLFLLNNVPIVEGKTLLFLDEIQACLPAIQSLRFFYEKKPGIHIIAAGSLLEFALQELPTFGVGRIRSLFMYPMSFNEFLDALGESNLLKKKEMASPYDPLPAVIHEKLSSLLKKFLMLGGMPEVVKSYVVHKDFYKCKLILNDLILSFQDDFAKYKRRIPVSRLRDLFDSVVKQTGGKFVFSKAGGGNHRQIKEALDMLIMAGLVHPVIHTSANGLPLSSEINPKRQKMFLFDTGIFQRILNLDLSDISLNEDFNLINKGNIAEAFVGLELLKSSSFYEKKNLYYWHREAQNSNAEIDYVVERKGRVIPIEVKAGTKGSMQSMFLFLQEKRYSKGIRVSNENFGSYDQIDVYPIYAINNFK